MYQPVLSRFHSLDPMSANGMDLLDDNNWFGDRFTRMRNLYGYVGNNPLNFVDPSGLQADSCAPDPCMACNEFLDKFPDKDRKYTYRGSKGTCIARIECAKSCRFDAPAYTEPAKKVAEGQYVIDVCISCSIHPDSLPAAIAHELQHVERFCRAGEGVGIQNCRECLIHERDAYENSCETAFKGEDVESRKKRTRCVACGLFYGCRGYMSSEVKVCVKDQDPPCTYTDIGLKPTT